MRLTADLRTWVALLGITASSAYAQQGTESLPYHPERLIVRFATGMSKANRDAVHATLGATELRAFQHIDGLVVLRVPAGEVLQKRAAFAARSDVLYAEPDFYIASSSIYPSDTYFEDQWALNNDVGELKADIDAPEAWEIWKGDAGFKIAVLDNGIDYNHPDLKDNLWFNVGEDIVDPGLRVINLTGGEPPRCGLCTDNVTRCRDSADCPEEFVCELPICCTSHEDYDPVKCPTPDGDFDCCDNDDNGYVDDLIGYDFGTHDGLPKYHKEHGTKAAGIIAAETDNGVGVAGINWNANLVTLKVKDERVLFDGDDEWRTWTSAAIEAIHYMIATGIRVSNNSWGTPYAHQGLHDAIVELQSASTVPGGHIFVAAAGNSTLNLDEARQCMEGAYSGSPCNDDAECEFCDDQSPTPGAQCTDDSQCAPNGTCGECKYNPGGSCFDGVMYGNDCDDNCDCCTCDGEGNCSPEDPQICIFRNRGPCDPLEHNCGTRIYPCTWDDLSNMICVAAVDREGGRASYSNTGATRVDLGAPGPNTLTTTTPENGIYNTFGGTSAAAPHVAGVVGLVMSLHPYDDTVPEIERWGWEKVKAWILTTVKPLDSLAGVTVTGGMVNAYNALYDCNNNGIPPGCELQGVDCSTSPECQAFAAMPGCGMSFDCNTNGIADECEIELEAPGPVSAPMAKSRFLSFSPTNAGVPIGLRVTLTNAHWEYTDCQDEQMWIGEPKPVTEESGTDGSDPPTFLAAPLQENPEYLDWGAYLPNDLHVYGAEILPGSTYQIEALWEECDQERQTTEDVFSDPLTIVTAIRGDVVGANYDPEAGEWEPPNGVVDFNDISAIVEKFKNLEGPPIPPVKRRADLIGVHPVHRGRPDLKIDFVDIGFAVDAYRGVPYSDLLAFGLPDTCN